MMEQMKSFSSERKLEEYIKNNKNEEKIIEIKTQSGLTDLSEIIRPRRKR